jgi:deoxyribodipyrimidine photo-lyase
MALMDQKLIIHWFRRDLRLQDNTALIASQRTGYPVIPVFILDQRLYAGSNASIARLAFLLEGLRSLDTALRESGTRLYVLRGDPCEVLRILVQKLNVEALYFNRDYSPFALRRDQEVVSTIGVEVRQFDDAVLIPPNALLTDSGSPYSVLTPFKKKWLNLHKLPSELIPQNARWSSHFPVESTDALFVWDKVPQLSELRPESVPVFHLPDASEASANERLDEFVKTRLYNYVDGRNHLAAPSDDTRGGSSFLSPYLRFGILSPRQAYWSARQAYKDIEPASSTAKRQHESVETWVSELVWRDFYMHILYHFPYVMHGCFRPKYDRLQWRFVPGELDAWKNGMTGYPVVDAAMRQLLSMGWMPNRARMIVASFLTKDLLISWREGERHFMKLLIDGDPAANNGGWQWSAGTGTDAQPYFRIFNPVQQSRDFDPNGNYIRHWVPELRDVPTPYIHAPWEWGRAITHYPKPIVEHRFARERTLAAFKAL